METTAIILAGGKSSRMGKNKALLKINEKTVIESIVQEVRQVVDEIIIVTNSFSAYSFLKLPMVEDIYKGKGPLAGIHAGLSASSSSRNLVIACDMPFLNKEFSTYLLKQLDGFDAVVPNIEGRIHPLYAAYQKDTYTIAEQLLKLDELRIRSFLQKISVNTVNEQTIPINSLSIIKAVFNMNTPDDYKGALKIEDERT